MTFALLAILSLQRASPIDKATMAKCYALYKKYEIPLPKSDATFVVIPSYKSAPTIGFKFDHSDAFWGDPNVQLGYTEGAEMDLRDCEPSDELIDTCSLVYDRYTLPIATGVADAMALYDRGYKRLASRLMQRAIDSPPHGTFGDFPKGTSPLVAVSYTAFPFNMEMDRQYLSPSFSFDETDEDKKGIVTTLAKIFATEKDPAFQKKRYVIDEIKATFRSHVPESNVYDGSVDGLVTSRSVFWPRPFGVHQVPLTFEGRIAVNKDWHYLGVAQRGIPYVPTLIKHLDDNRISGAIQLAADGSIEYCTVGQLCIRILDSLVATGEPMNKAGYERWYRSVIQSYGSGVFTVADNKEYAWKRLSAPNSRFSDELLTLLSQDRLPALLKLYAKRRDVPLEPILDRMVGLRLPNDPKPSAATISAFQLLAASDDYHKSILGIRALQEASGSQDYLLGNTSQVDATVNAVADKALLAAVQKLPSYSEAALAKVNLSEIADAMIGSWSPTVWNAYAKACARVPPQARALLIYHASLATNGVRQEDQYSRFARHFFNDNTPIPDVMAMYGETSAQFPGIFVPKTIGELALHCSAIVIGVSYPVEHDRPDLLTDLRKWVDQRTPPEKIKH